MLPLGGVKCRVVLKHTNRSLLVLLGLAALNGLPVRQYPDIEVPVVSIETSYRGASAEVVETKVTQVIEDRIAGIEGIEKLTSNSRDERSDIRVEFSLDRDVEAAAMLQWKSGRRKPCSLQVKAGQRAVLRIPKQDSVGVLRLSIVWIAIK